MRHKWLELIRLLAKIAGEFKTYTCICFFSFCGHVCVFIFVECHF